MARITLFYAPFALALTLRAQTTAPQENAAQDTGAATPPGETPVMMSAFQVESTENKGYITKNSATAFKTDEALVTIPQAVMVVTRDMITDTGYYQSSDVLAFAGVVDFFRGESYELRGVRLGYDLIDELPGISAYMDDIFIDSYEVIRGPAAVFYPTAQLGGVVLKTTRKPLDYSQNIVSYSENQWGLNRTEFDSTGPLTKLGDGVLAYRVEGAYQTGQTYFDNVADDSKAIHASFQWSNAQNRVLIAGDAQDRYSVPFGAAFLNPDGSVFDSGGRKAEANMPPDGNEMYRYTALRLQFQHTIGTDWEMKQYVMMDMNTYHGTYLYSSGINYLNQTTSWGAASEHGRYRGWAILGDFTGKYNIFGNIGGRSTFGYTAQKIDYRYPNLDTDPGLQTSWSNIPFTQPNMNYIHMPLVSQSYQDPTSPWGGPTEDAIDFTAYFQQELDLVPNRFSIVAGGSWRYIETDNLAQTYTQDSFPYGSTDTVLSLGIYRIGAVLQLIPKQVSVYVMQSTTANSNGGDLGPGQIPLPPQQGLGKEVGLKTDILNGMISSTIAVYNIQLTNVAQFVGYSPTGVAEYGLVGQTTQKGWDTDVTFQPIPNFGIVGTYQIGSVENQAGLQVANSYRGMWSVFGKYEFPKTSGLTGLAIGGGASEIEGRLEGDGGYTLTPAQVAGLVDGNLIKAKSEVLANAFVNYRFLKHWTVSLTINNIFNANFAQGAQAAAFVDPSDPLTFGGKIAYKF